jgi:aryl-alcohol dehydrogenase-like predicted oxidoreductase|tara:strand:- start:862 stop:1725 length:864 start_codon:yes stop_codon:yes gene_type:complete
LNLTKLAIGSAQFGLNYGISNKKGIVQQEEIVSILKVCKETGINSIDTAKGYGHSEEALGMAIQSLKYSQWNIITKIHRFDSNISNQIKKSASRLTIPINTVLAHSFELFMDKSFQNQLNKNKLNGQIQKFGVSLYTKKEILSVLESKILPDIIQLPLNILDSKLYKDGIIRKIYNKKIEIHVRSVFLQGLFYLSAKDIKNRFPDAYSTIYRLKKIASKAKVSIAELSLLWVLSLDEIKKIIIGVENSDQLKMHIESFKKSISQDLFKEALRISYNNKYVLNPSLWK